MTPISDTALKQLFVDARTHSHWQPRPVPDAVLRSLYEMLRYAPTSANCSPARFVFVRSAEGKARLKPCLAAGNVDKTMAAPVTAIVAHDSQFTELLPRLYPHADARSWFAGNQPLTDITAFRNGTLQGRLPDPGRACARAGLRSDVRFRQCVAGCRVLSRRPLEIKFPDQSRFRRGRQAARPLSPAGVRRRLPAGLTAWPYAAGARAAVYFAPLSPPFR